MCKVNRSAAKSLPRSPTPKEEAMLGQQETMRVPSGALRRMLSILAVAALMAALMVIVAAPAFAASAKLDAPGHSEPKVTTGNASSSNPAYADPPSSGSPGHTKKDRN